MADQDSILIVDDDDDVRSSLALILDEQGYETGIARDGREALEKAQGGCFNVALVDIRLPDLDGLALLLPLKGASPDMDVVFVTGHADLESAVGAMNRGASGYMVKPLDMDEVLATVGRICERQQLIRGKRRAEEALRESEEKYRTLFETMSQGVVYRAADGRVTAANPAAERILGLTLDQMTGRTPMDPRWQAVCEDGSNLPGDEHPAMVSLRTGQEVRDVVMGVLHPGDASYRWIDVSASPQCRPGQDKPYQVYATFTDITQSRLAQEELRQSEEKFRNVVESSPLGMHMYRLDPDGRLVLTGANPAADAILGLDNQQLIGKEIEDAFPATIGSDVPERYRRVAAEGAPWHVEQVAYKDHRVAGAFQLDAFQTSPGRMVATFLDITERMQMEQDLRQEKEFSEGLISAMLDGAVVIDRRPVITHVNPAFCEMTGFTREELIGTAPPFPHWPPEDYDALSEALTTAVGGDFAHRESTLMRKNGERFPVSFSPSWVKDGEGNVVCNFVTFKEITERKRMEAALRDALAYSRQREVEISALLEGSRAVLVSHKFADAARSIFDTCKVLLGAEAGLVLMLSEDGREDLMLVMDLGGLPCAVDPSLPMPVRGLRKEVYRTGEAAYDNDFANSDRAKLLPPGHAGLDSILLAPMVIGRTTVGALCFANKPGGFSENDARLATAFGELAAISVRNSWALESLEDSEERFRIVVASAGDAIISYDSQGKVMSWNRAAETMFGYSADEVVGRSLARVVPEQLRADYEAGASPLLSPGEESALADPVETVGLMKGGVEFPMEVTVATWNARGGVFLTAIARDITHRKEAEARIEGLYRQEKELREQVENEMRKRVEFTRALAHELKTPLTPVVMSSQLLTQKLEDETLLRVARNIERGAANLNSRIDELLDLARGEVGMLQIRRERMDLPDLLREVVEEVSPLPASRGQQLVSKLPPGIPPVISLVSADRVRVKQVVLNLLNNAFKYTREGGQITLSVRQEASDVIVEVKDTGPGMAKEDQERIFDPYHRIDSDRERLSGLGLGLALCKALVELHGGEIWVTSKVGKGSTFGFSLPIDGNSIE